MVDTRRREFMKKFLKLISIILCLMLCLSFVACSNDKDDDDDDSTGGGGGANKGQTISSEQAQTIMDQFSTMLEDMEQSIEESSQEIPLQKFTLTITNVQDECTTTLTDRYSAENNYFYSEIHTTNQNLYDYETGELYHTTHRHDYYAHTYVDANGKLVKAVDSYDDSTNFYQGESNRQTIAEKEYNYLDDDPSTAVNTMQDKLFNSSSSFLTEYFTISESMLTTIEPLLSFGEFSSSGYEIKSLGAGHLYIKIEMMGMFYEMEITDYILVYYKTEMDMSQIPGGNAGLETYQHMSSELRLQKDVCTISYPDLTGYTFNPYLP